MKRRNLLVTLAGLPATASLPPSGAASSTTGRELDNPYAEVDWDTWDCLHSMSHQHQGQTDASRDGFLEMGYRHLAFSNYYPSAPTYPLPANYLAKHPEVIAAPNAEHHSFTDAGLHFNALGSLLATGYGSNVSAKECAISPIVHRFENLEVFNTERPWLGVYRLDVRLSASEGKPTARLTIEGANECGFREGFSDKGPICDRELPPGNHTLYLRTTATSVETKLVFDTAALSVTQYRLMQGANRPWRDVFRAALDGEMIDGKRSGGLLHGDDGGLTLNHPTGKLADYAPMLDFDPRVLGIEVWNQLTSGFGSSRGFYDHSGEPNLHFYQLWMTSCAPAAAAGAFSSKITTPSVVDATCCSCRSSPRYLLPSAKPPHCVRIEKEPSSALWHHSQRARTPKSSHRMIAATSASAASLCKAINSKSPSQVTIPPNGPRCKSASLPIKASPASWMARRPSSR
jgi:hypothetical protein